MIATNSPSLYMPSLNNSSSNSAPRQFTSLFANGFVTLYSSIPAKKSGRFARSLRLDTNQPLPAELPLFAEPPRVASGTGRSVTDPGSLLTNG